MVLNEKRKLRLTEFLARRQGAPTDVGPSAIAPTNATPLAAAPPAQDSRNPPVVVVAVDFDDEDTGEGITFKRRRMVAVATHSSTEAPPASYWEHPLMPLLPANHWLSKAVGRAFPRAFPCHLPLSFLPSSNMLRGAFKRGRWWRA